MTIHGVLFDFLSMKEHKICVLQANLSWFLVRAKSCKD